MSDEPWRRSATDLQTAIRRRELSCVEVMQAHLARIEAVNPRLNAIVTLDAEPALARGAPRPTRALATRRAARAAARAADRGQGPRGHRRHADDVRLADLPRPRPGRRRAARRAAAARRRDRHRQDEHAGVRRRLADLQPRLRRDAQPVRPRAHAGRQQRRRGGRGGDRDGAVRRRLRPRRRASATRPRSATSSACARRPAASRPAPRPTLGPAGGARADGAHGRRTRRCCSARSPGRTRARRCRSRRRRPARPDGDLARRCGSPGAATSATCRSSRR